MRHTLPSACLLLLFSVVLPALGAQQPDTSAVEVAVARYIRPRLTSGLVAFDPRVHLPTTEGSGVQTTSRPYSRNLRLATELSIRLAALSDVTTCEGTPRACRFTDVVGLIALGRPVFSGDTAVIDVQYWQAQRRPPGLHQASYALVEVTLVRRNGRWEVSQEKPLIAS